MIIKSYFQNKEKKHPYFPLGDAKRNHVLLPFVQDKSKLERDLLCASHEELDDHKFKGENNLSNSYVNEIP